MKYWDAMWNFVMGCTPCSPACDRCYAARWARRMAAMTRDPDMRAAWNEVVGPNGWTGQVRVRTTLLLDGPVPPGKAIFVCGMSDLFHEDVPIETIHSVYGMAKTHPDTTFLLLTKRPGRMLEAAERLVKYEWDIPSNLWWGVTAWDQNSLESALLCLSQIAGHRWLSLEPLLNPVSLASDTLCAIDQVIVGGETGKGARAAELEWFRTIRDECRGLYIPFFLKQISGKRGDRGLDGRTHDDLTWRARP